MKVTLWKSGYLKAKADPLANAVPKSVPKEDPRAARYLAKAHRFNAVATELGYESLEHAIKAGRMREIFARVSASTPTDAADGLRP
jgi:hypothetical protein